MEILWDIEILWEWPEIPYEFPHVFSTNVGISPKKFLTFSFTPFEIFLAIPSASPIELEPRPSLKKIGF